MVNILEIYARITCNVNICLIGPGSSLTFDDGIIIIWMSQGTNGYKSMSGSFVGQLI